MLINTQEIRNQQISFPPPNRTSAFNGKRNKLLNLNTPHILDYKCIHSKRSVSPNIQTRFIYIFPASMRFPKKR